MQTLVAELRLSGRVGGRRLRGRVLAGLSDPGAVRLEGLAPFGVPVFILVAEPGRAALLLPRESRVLVDAPADEVVHALAGVAMTADELRHVLSACVPASVGPTIGRAYGSDWWGIETSDGGLVYLRRAGDARRIVAVRRGGWLSEYSEWSGRLPGRLRLTSVTPTTEAVDLTVTLSQVRINTTLDPATFVVEIPPDAVPMTLEELKARAPLEDSAPASGS
jgi:hypothetical protein